MRVILFISFLSFHLTESKNINPTSKLVPFFRHRVDVTFPYIVQSMTEWKSSLEQPRTLLPGWNGPADVFCVLPTQRGVSPQHLQRVGRVPVPGPEKSGEVRVSSQVLSFLILQEIVRLYQSPELCYQLLPSIADLINDLNWLKTGDLTFYHYFRW